MGTNPTKYKFIVVPLLLIYLQATFGMGATLTAAGHWLDTYFVSQLPKDESRFDAAENHELDAVEVESTDDSSGYDNAALHDGPSES